jgi:hypothetical protein
MILRDKDGRGGKREGAGRPPLLGERLERVMVRLTPAMIERLKRLGNGNVSAGLRALMERHPDD